MNLSNRTPMATIGTQWLIDEGIAARREILMALETFLAENLGEN